MASPSPCSLVVPTRHLLRRPCISTWTATRGAVLYGRPWRMHCHCRRLIASLIAVAGGGDEEIISCLHATAVADDLARLVLQAETGAPVLKPRLGTQCP